MAQNWEHLIASKKSHQQASIPEEWILTNHPSPNELNVLTFPDTCGLLTLKEIEITNTHVDVLLNKLASAEWSSVEVTTAFGKRAIIAHQLTSCLTEIFIGRALVRAAEIDAHLKATSTTIGPLHRLPISLKDQVMPHGLANTLSVTHCWLMFSKPLVLCSTCKQTFRKHYTNGKYLLNFFDFLIDEHTKWPETYNLLFGRTTNPNNCSFTCGGSSGGEGALVGVGSDIGGSIRIPSSFCGTYGFRPSTGRVPYSGSVNSLDGQDNIPSVLGPLSNSIHGLKVFIQGVLSQKSWLRDPLVIRKGWSNEEYNLVEDGGGKELCFAVMWSDGLIAPHPPIIRGLEMAKNALIKAGHKVIDWKPLDHKTILDTGLSIFRAGAAEDFAAVTAKSGEPFIKSMVPGKEIPDNDSSVTTKKAPFLAYELWQLQKKKRDLRRNYLEHWLTTASETGTGRPVDAIIAPAAPFTAVPHGKNTYVGYTMVWNVLDPALVIPVSRVDPVLDMKKPAHEFFSDLDKSFYELYEPETFKDAPIGFQVVGRTHEDEAVIAMAEIVDEALKAL